MKSRIKKMMQFVEDGYTFVCVFVVTVIIWLLLIFGGSVSVEINFDAWSELMSHLFKKH